MIKNRILYCAFVLMFTVMFMATNHYLILLLLICFLAVAAVSFGVLLYEKSTQNITIVFPRSGDIRKEPALHFVIERKWILPIGRLRLHLEYENSLYEKKKLWNCVWSRQMKFVQNMKSLLENPNAELSK
ncbi:MAG: hypothetical protein PHP50_12430 [Lachnospiraceae bacterium]|nr:hypothetical protein [Lachnospiraceae bacterium]